MGIPSPFYHIELRGKDGTPVAVGEIGEVVVIPNEDGKQPGIFTAYLDNEEQYNYVWRGGVYHTGDAAYRDENGHYWFHGRFDDIIKTGGFRVGPYEVENVLMEHPAVVECSVIGVPDSSAGPGHQGGHRSRPRLCTFQSSWNWKSRNSAIRSSLNTNGSV